VSKRSRDEHKPAVNKAVDSDAAVDILAELRRQQQEQMQLIHEQRAIVDELRRHENVAHHLHDDNKYQVCVLVCVFVCTRVRVSEGSRFYRVEMPFLKAAPTPPNAILHPQRLCFGGCGPSCSHCSKERELSI